MEKFSERWFRNIERIVNTIFSFILSWNIIVILYYLEKLIYNYLGHLRHTTGNPDYYTVQLLLIFVSCLADFILVVMPIYIARNIIYRDKAD